MLLQIPVEGGHRGGDFHVRFGREICSYRPEANSGDAFHVHVFYDDCRHRLERLTDGWRLVLVFRLVVRKSALRTPALLDRPPCVSTSEAAASARPAALRQHVGGRRFASRALAATRRHRHGRRRGRGAGPRLPPGEVPAMMPDDDAVESNR